MEQHEIIHTFRAFNQVLRHTLEVCKDLVDTPSQHHHFPFHMEEGFLYVSEDDQGTR